MHERFTIHPITYLLVVPLTLLGIAAAIRGLIRNEGLACAAGVMLNGVVLVVFVFLAIEAALTIEGLEALADLTHPRPSCNNPVAVYNPPPSPPLDRLKDFIKLPPGFEISIYAKVGDVREIELGEHGTVFVSGIRALVDRDNDNIADPPIPVLRESEGPLQNYLMSNWAFHRGALYVTARAPLGSDLLRFDNVEARLGSALSPTVVQKKAYVPGAFAFGPDGMMYVHSGSGSSIVRMKADGSGAESFAEGVRSPSMDWHPVTHELWFIDSAATEYQPAELNFAPKPGLHFGYPYFYGQSVPDPYTKGSGRNPADFVPPALVLRESVTPWDVKFYSGKMFPAEYQNQIFITEHGGTSSGRRVAKAIMLVRLENNKPVKYETFAEGWNWPDGRDWGEPYKLLVMPDGALLVSDITAGVIYRIGYRLKT